MSQSEIKADYLFYPTILDGFVYYLNSDTDYAYKNMLDRLNRVPFTSEAASKGTAFNDVVDFCIANYGSIHFEEDTIRYKGFDFKKSMVKEFVKRLPGAEPQYRCEGFLQTSRGMVQLYGYVDEIYRDCVVDIKTTANYSFPHYLNNLQHIVYPFCLRQQDINCDRFKYMVTDFSNYYEEEYIYDAEKDVPRLIDITEQLIDFIEMNSDRITDRKLFNYRQAA